MMGGLKHEGGQSALCDGLLDVLLEACGDSARTVRDTDSLVQFGLDSLGLVRLSARLKARFGVTVPTRLLISAPLLRIQEALFDPGALTKVDVGAPVRWHTLTHTHTHTHSHPLTLTHSHTHSHTHTRSLTHVVNTYTQGETRICSLGLSRGSSCREQLWRGARAPASERPGRSRHRLLWFRRGLPPE